MGVCRRMNFSRNLFTVCTSSAKSVLAVLDAGAQLVAQLLPWSIVRSPICLIIIPRVRHAQQHHQIVGVKEKGYSVPDKMVIELLPRIQQEMIGEGKASSSAEEHPVDGGGMRPPAQQEMRTRFASPVEQVAAFRRTKE